MSWKVHQLAHCRDCDRQWDNKDTAYKEAAKHVRKTGHTVHGETGIAWMIEPKTKKKQP